MKYTHEERLEIGRRIYTGEISKYQAAAEYEINDQTARNYMRIYRDTIQWFCQLLFLHLKKMNSGR